MLASQDKYRIYCVTDARWEYEIATSEPTVCPVNAGHTVNAGSIAIIESGLVVGKAYEASATLIASTTSPAYVRIDSMILTPRDGIYNVTFSSSGWGNAKDQLIEYALFEDGVIIDHSRRQMHNVSGHLHTLDYAMVTYAEVDVDGTEDIEVKIKTTTSESFVCERSLTARLVA